MTAQSGIGCSEALRDTFASLQADTSICALFVEIKQERLEPAAHISAQGDEATNFQLLREEAQPTSPAYVLFRLDSGSWMLVVYVPNEAKVRDKMLYASTRASLTKQLGESNFTDSLFATTRDDLTTSSFKQHLTHRSSAAPLTDRERESADIKAAEGREVHGTSVKSNYLRGAKTGLKWSEEVEQAITELGDQKQGMVSLNIDVPAETLQLLNKSDQLAVPSEVSYTFYYHSPSSQFVCIYCCPSTSPVKSRMLYSSSIAFVVVRAGELGLKVAKRLETSDPEEITESYLTNELGGGQTSETNDQPISPPPVTQGFAKPKRPGKK